MIKSFGDAVTERLWNTGTRRRLPPEVVQRALDRLQLINAAERIEFLRLPPSNRLKRLSGDLKLFWSMRVNDQWRLIFKFDDGDATDVRLVDYH